MNITHCFGAQSRETLQQIQARGMDVLLLGPENPADSTVVMELAIRTEEFVIRTENSCLRHLSWENPNVDRWDLEQFPVICDRELFSF